MLQEIKVFIGGPNDGLEAQRRIHVLIEGIIRPALRRQHCLIESFHWNTPRRKQVTDGDVPIQRRIQQSSINPENCDVFIGYFKVKPRRGKPLDEKFCRTSLDEIDLALGREPPSRVLLLYEDVDSSSQIGSLSDEEMDEFKAKRGAVTEMRRRIEIALAPHRERLGKPLKLQRLEPGQVGHLEENLHPLIENLLGEVRLARAPEPTTEAPQALSEENVRAPYVGLAELTIDDGDIFFGHTKAQNTLLDILRGDPEFRLLFIHGPSGTGKSSLLKAGLLHQIVRKQALANRPHWAYAEFNPSDANGDPFQALVEACLTHTGSRLPVKRNQLAEQLRRASSAGIDAAQAELERLLLRFPPGCDGLILAVNQLEELWGTASALREQFLTLIAAAARTVGYLVLGSLRSDRLAEFTTAPQILPLLQQQKSSAFPLGAPDMDMLVEMIAEPARVAEIELEGGLARAIARQIVPLGDAALPILATLMRKLWLPQEDEPPRTRITHADFECAGSPTDIIQTLVTRISIERDKSTLQSLFERLIDVRDGRVIAIRTPLDLLVRGDERRTELVNQLAGEARVLQIGDGPGSPVRIAHESLFELWPDLKSWIEFNLDDHALRDELVREARLWAERGLNGSPPLMSQERLKDVSELQQERPELFLALPPNERRTLQAYLDRCEIVRQRELLIQAVKGGEVSHAVACLRKLKSLLPPEAPVLEEAQRGYQTGAEPGQLKCEFWAAITGDDVDRNNEGHTIFDDAKGKERFENEASRRMTPLSWAAVAGQLGLMKRLVQRGANLHQKDQWGGNLLHAAASGGHPEVVRYLIKEGVDPAAVDSYNNPPILWAINHDQREVVEILRPFQRLDFQAQDGWNALTEAARANDVALLQQLVVNEHYRVDYRSGSGGTPLHVASGSDRTATDDAVRWLISNHAPLDAVDIGGMTPLHYAAGSGKVTIIELLVDAAGGDREAFLNACDDQHQTPLHHACASRHAHAARRLLERGADPNIGSATGHTALAIAVASADLRSVRLLLESSAYKYEPVDARAHIGWAVAWGDRRLLKLLLRHAPQGALNAEMDGWTPIMVAAGLGYDKLAVMLLEAGADPRLSDKLGDALDHATFGQSAETLEAIKDWARSKDEFRGWLAKRERDLAVRSVGAHLGELSPISDMMSSLPTHLSIEDLRERRARGMERREAAAFLMKAVSDDSLEMVDAVLELMGPLLQPDDLNSAATVAGGQGLAPIARRLMEAGAEEPWWWHRRKITEEQLGFLRFEDLPHHLIPSEKAPWNEPPMPVGPKRVRSAKLPFLAGKHLVVAECTDCPGQNEVFFLETAGSGLQRVNWTNDLIYEITEASATISPEVAPQYARWFFAMIRGRLGRFQFVDQVSDIPWTSLATPEIQEEVGRHLKSLRLTRQKDDHLILRGSTVFKNALFESSVRIALKTGAKFGSEKAVRGQLRLEREKLLLEDLPIEIDGPRWIFG